MAKTTFHMDNGRVFEFEAHLDFHGLMVCYMMYEVVRPHWKIFRRTYCKSGNFWVSDFPTIQEGLKNGLRLFLEEESLLEECRKKFEDFEKVR